MVNFGSVDPHLQSPCRDPSPSMSDQLPSVGEEYTIRGIISDVEIVETDKMREFEPEDVRCQWHRSRDCINRLIDHFRATTKLKTGSPPVFSGEGWAVRLTADPSVTSWTEQDEAGTKYHVEGNISKRSSGNSVYYSRTSPDNAPAATASISENVAVNVDPWWRRIGGACLANPPRVHAVESPNLVIKYENTCMQLYLNRNPWIDTLFSEYIIMKSIEGLHISPEVVTLSDPTFPTLVEWKSDPRIKIEKDINIETSVEPFYVDKRAHVRAMVISRAGMSLGDFRSAHLCKTREFLILCIRIGLRTIELLQKLHDAGFVHGDIHLGNVAFRSLGSETSVTPDIVLLDFGLSRFFPAEYGKTFGETHPSGFDSNLKQSLLSPWQFREGNRSGRRDDIYRVFELVLNLLSPNDEFRDFLMMRHDKEPEGHMMYPRKLFGRFFVDVCFVVNGSLLRICDIYAKGEVNINVCQRAMEHLQRAFEQTRSIIYPDSRPNYTQLKQSFQDAIHVLTNRYQ